MFFLLLFVTQWCCGKTKCMEGLDEILSIDNTSYIHIIYIDIYIFFFGNTACRIMLSLCRNSPQMLVGNLLAFVELSTFELLAHER